MKCLGAKGPGEGRGERASGGAGRTAGQESREEKVGGRTARQTEQHTRQAMGRQWEGSKRLEAWEVETGMRKRAGQWTAGPTECGEKARSTTYRRRKRGLGREVQPIQPTQPTQPNPQRGRGHNTEKQWRKEVEAGRRMEKRAHR